jgi:hypothetical protein
MNPTPSELRWQLRSFLIGPEIDKSDARILPTLEKHLTDPEAARQMLTNVRVEIETASSFIQFYKNRCHVLYEGGDIDAPEEEWLFNIARAAMLVVHKRNENAMFKIGMRVYEVEVDEDGNRILDSTGQPIRIQGRYGIVVPNVFLGENETRPHKDSMHNIFDVRVKPEVPDDQLATAEYDNLPKPLEGYPPDENGETSMPKTRAYDWQYVEFLASLVAVEWHREDNDEVIELFPGSEVWCHPEFELETIP